MSMKLSKPWNRGFWQAYVGNFIVLAIVSNMTVWNALSYANSVSPLLASFSLSLALQEDSGQNIAYILLRTASVSLGGAVGLLVLYLVFWSNGSSFDPTLVKGATFVVFVTCILSTVVYFFRPPVWSVRYKSALISGIAVCLVGGDGYWSGDRPLPLIYAFILANMSIGLAMSYIVAHAVLPIRKSVVVREQLSKAMGMLEPTARQAVDVLTLRGPQAMNIPAVPVEVGAILIKVRVMLLSSVQLEHTWQPFARRFPVAAHLRMCVLFRQYVSTYGTLLDVMERSAPSVVTESASKRLHELGNAIEASFAYFGEHVAGAEFSGQPPVKHQDHLERLEAAVEELLTYLGSSVNTELLRTTKGSSRAAMAMVGCLGCLVMRMYPVFGECFGSSGGEALDPRRDIADQCAEEAASLGMGAAWASPALKEAKHHRRDCLSRTVRQILGALHLEAKYMKAVAQAAVAITSATVLLVCPASYEGLGGHALWVLVTVWIMSAQSTIGSVILKSANRVFGTVIAAAVAYATIYLVFLLNGLSYENRALKYVMMTLLFPLGMALLHRQMIRAPPQYKYAFYVSKITVAITTLATFNEETPNPTVPAWRLLAVLIGLGIEFVVKSCLFYRETSTTMRHQIQDILETLARGGWRDQRLREVTASKISGLETLEQLVCFEDTIARYLHLPRLFDRRLVNQNSMKTLRKLLRLVLNRLLTTLYLESSLRALSAEAPLAINDIVSSHLLRAQSTLVPACLLEIGALFGYDTAYSQGQSFEELRSCLEEARAIMVHHAESDGIDVMQMTWTIGLTTVLGSLADTMVDLREYVLGLLSCEDE